MPDVGRGPDYLELFDNVSRRVRNLETGVHPTLAEGAYADVVPPTDIPITGPFSAYFTPTSGPSIKPQWQRRFGMVTLLGGVRPDGGWSARGEEEVVGTLPPGARPLAEVMMNGAMRSSPYVALVRVQTSGVISIFNPHAAGDEGVRFDGLAWTID